MTTSDINPQEPEYAPSPNQLEHSSAMPVVIPQEPEFQPSFSQLERANAIRRFNRIYIYFPIGSLSAIVLLLVIALIYLALNPPTIEALQTLSGIADAVVILGLMPTIVICGAVPALFVVVTVQARKRGMAPIRQLQILLWRMDRGVGIARLKVDEIAPKIARPFIIIHASLAYFKTLLIQIIGLIKRS